MRPCSSVQDSYLLSIGHTQRVHGKVVPTPNTRVRSGRYAGLTRIGGGRNHSASGSDEMTDAADSTEEEGAYSNQYEDSEEEGAFNSDEDGELDSLISITEADQDILDETITTKDILRDGKRRETDRSALEQMGGKRTKFDFEVGNGLVDVIDLKSNLNDRQSDSEIMNLIAMRRLIILMTRRVRQIYLVQTRLFL
jgi:hypothetical protein